MRRKLLIAVIAVLIPLGWVAWWVINRHAESSLPELPPIVKPKPLRPPELFGKIEAVRHIERDGSQYLVRSTQPQTPGWDSEQNAWHRKIDMPCWVAIRAGVPVRRHDGGAADLAVGQVVSAWCSGPMATTNPPIWWADAVVIEPDDK